MRGIFLSLSPRRIYARKLVMGIIFLSLSPDCICNPLSGLVVRSRLLGPEGFRFETRFRQVWGLLHVKSYVVAKHPAVDVTWKFGEGVPAQVSSSSDRGSKLRGPSQNSPRVASELDVNI
ncbi:hypothetical protein AVEN_101644-1 [Araneus ventricosus]|uniref:Uncharacterized protein n=1 Tax=Araneus ventricosus TaxID=182803 RepID=A0A4Y2EXR5_ARAVE|nr:hypothetical protein AVEN_101644-1 [Araneus ventricosus]